MPEWEYFVIRLIAQTLRLIKRHLTDSVNEKDIESQITEAFENVPKNEYLKTFNKWLERIQLCINNKGDYFELGLFDLFQKPVSEPVFIKPVPNQFQTDLNRFKPIFKIINNGGRQIGPVFLKK